MIPHNRLPNLPMLKEEEIDLLLVDLLELYGYDFNYYSRESLKRRVSKLFRLEKFGTFADFQQKVRTDGSYIEHLVDRITVNVTEMFRDVEFFGELRHNVLPALQSLPEIWIWHAGCSTGEEVYSMAILLHEAGLLERTHICATDINPLVLNKAGIATYPHSLMQLYARNYKASGGTGDFSSYFTKEAGGAKVKAFLAEQIRFTAHNLASDIYLGKFNCIVCRNVVIYFDKPLRERAFQLFDLSLIPGSYLALGEKETLRSSTISGSYKQEGKEKIWKKIK